RHRPMLSGLCFLIAGWVFAQAAVPAPPAAPPPVLAEIDRIVRDRFFDPKLKGVDWSGAVAKASADLSKPLSADGRDAVYDRLLEVDGKAYGRDRVSFRDLFFALEGVPGSAVVLKWQSGDAPPRSDRIVREPEPSGDSLVWSSARVIRRGGKAYGYAHLWGMS